MENWDEIRTAYHVARHGTVSGAAQALGVHHATVIRHVDALEYRLGTKLFQRHARGYTPTEAGQDVLAIAGKAQDQFTQLANRIKGRGDSVSGDLIITSLEALSPLLIPAIADFQALHPGLHVNLINDTRLFRLEYGEAHIAIRAGTVPDQPDNIVQPFFTQTIRLVAHKSYVDQFGMLTDDTYAKHRFIGPSDPTTRAPYYRWLTQNVPNDNICFRTTGMLPAKKAVLAGVGIGFIADWDTDQTDDLIDMMPPQDAWAAKIWLVTHMDLHRTAKVQHLVQHLKNKGKIWGATPQK
jgi:DNA-binding transcriptional LysR family regulator